MSINDLDGFRIRYGEVGGSEPDKLAWKEEVCGGCSRAPVSASVDIRYRSRLCPRCHTIFLVLVVNDFIFVSVPSGPS